jgi:hypothetical protein
VRPKRRAAESNQIEEAKSIAIRKITAHASMRDVDFPYLSSKSATPGGRKWLNAVSGNKEYAAATDRQEVAAEKN